MSLAKIPESKFRNQHGEYEQNDYSAAEYFKDPDPEHAICSKFGCGHELTITERLFGNRCHRHQHVEKIDPTVYAQS